MAHGKRGMCHKKRAWRSAILKGPRGNTTGDLNLSNFVLLLFDLHSYRYQYMHKSLDEFEFRSNLITDYGVSSLPPLEGLKI